VVKAELVALTDRDRGLAETVAARYGWTAIADDWQGAGQLAGLCAGQAG
jgi:predicted dehydrogenase